MCGIAGFLIYTGKRSYTQNDFARAKESTKILSYRGPDNQTVTQVNEHLIFGHTRLSIIDVSSSSNQPFVSDCGSYTLTFNGEIYNYIEIREELIAKGHQFTTDGDTEVLLKAYIEWKEECVNKFNGMWAFALYDKLKNQIFCSRDRFGVKPFNYTVYDEQFVFASEIKVILSFFPDLCKPNYNVISNFCRKGLGAQNEDTWFENVKRLPAAHNIIINNSGQINCYRYWQYPVSNNQLSFEEAKNKFKSLFVSSVKLRMRSDVPVGITLSSGLDSNSIAYTLREFYKEDFNAYTAYSDEKKYLDTDKRGYANNEQVVNEIDIVKKTANDLKFNLKAKEIQYSNFIYQLKQLVYHLESGHRSPAILALDQILEIASKEVKVVLEGQGADELLGGYINLFFLSYFRDLVGKFKFKKAWNELKLISKTYSISYIFKLYFRSLDNEFISKLYYRFNYPSLFVGRLKTDFKYLKDSKINVRYNSKLKSTLYKQHSSTLQDLLHYGDAISMKHSIESRLPFMDYRIVEHAFSCESEYLIKEGLGKYLQRLAMLNIVPDDIRLNKIKYGFNTPLTSYLIQNGEETAENILLSETCIQRNLFDKKSVKAEFDKLKSNSTNSNPDLLFRLLGTELWFRTFIDKNG